MQTTLHFLPLIPLHILFILGGILILLCGLSFILFRKSLLWRLIAITAVLLVLANPSLLEEERKMAKDTAVIVVDHSKSQKTNDRIEKTDSALSNLKKQFSNIENLDLRIVDVGGALDSLERETHLFKPLDQAISDIPPRRRAGVIFITDGQVHDIPEREEQFKEYGPVHVLLSGDKKEQDRKLELINAPSYGIVGQNTKVVFKITDTHPDKDYPYATLRVSSPGQAPIIQEVAVNEEHSFSFKIDHAGQNILELAAQKKDGEHSVANNKTALVINGIRDRLRVLLISGQPYIGERTWRNFLNADPGVDLVHFTILRPPSALNFVPKEEMSLIPFPMHELFEEKIYDFDLIIFDRYRLNGIMLGQYFKNIAQYVEQGGAFLESSGPDFSGDRSIYNTALKDILPLAPSGTLKEKEFKPTLTELGKRHPVTSTLPAEMDWGPWMRQIDTYYKNGDILLNGIDDRPLLVLDHVKKGRVAHITSDQIWLWAKTYKNKQGGPYTDLLRHIVHWLMKEPSLEENALHLQIRENQIFIKAHNLYETKEPYSVTVTKPNGKKQELILKETETGWLETTYTADEIGVYAFDNGEHTYYGIIGDLNPPELLDLIGTAKKMEPVTKASNGSISWLEDTTTPTIRMIEQGRSSFSGKRWIGLKRNNDYTVTSYKETHLIPSWLSLFMLVFVLIFAWWRESQSR